MPLISSLGVMNAIGIGLFRVPLQYIAVAHTTTPFISTYPWSAGYGTKYANPATLPGSTAAYSVSFNSTGTAIAVSGFGSPYVSTYPWRPGFGTKYANPATLPGSSSLGVAFSK